MKSFYNILITVVLIVITSIFFYFNTGIQLNKNVCQDSILNKHKDLALNPYNDFIFSILHDDTIKIKELLVKKLISIDSAVKYSADVELKINNHSWTEIVRIGNTQKMITTIAQKEDNQWLGKRTCSVPEPKLLAIYEALNYKQKFVVLKIPPRKELIEVNQRFR